MSRFAFFLRWFACRQPGASSNGARFLHTEMSFRKPSQIKLALGRIVNIGFHDERVSTNFGGSSVFQLLTMSHDQMIHLFQRAGLQQAQRIADATRGEVGFIPIA